MPAGVNVSRDLRWMLTKEWSTHMVKVRNYPKAFSKDPLNPKGLHLPRFSGSVQTKAVTVRQSTKNKGVTLIYKKKHTQRQPGKQLVRVVLKKDPRKTLGTIKNTLNSMKGYRKDLKMLALRRASTLLKSQQSKQKKRKQSKRQKRKTKSAK